MRHILLETTTAPGTLSSDVSKSITSGFQTLISALTIPAILLLIGLIVWSIINLSRRFMQLSKTDVSEYKHELKKLIFYGLGVLVLFIALGFLIVQNSNGWSILNQT
ncbi:MULTISPECIES: hypothetical protein [unclassified Mycoplasma]|uniref:hypothetical protein n=1 Tax=unclassified Mycoplasma TaxID=2683645 RepID=UPI001C127EFE|nr:MULTISPECIES: hypothetical protein [unclassified Mycoplasma]MBU4693234.1 hypothetical protein [Mycoplasma sp. CSL7491-lung]MCU4706987.1 hypothetical protein [Mycoplasma sp. CSL7503-lung]